MGVMHLLMEEDMTNVTPTILPFLWRFLIVFGLIALIAVLTPKMAEKVDAIRARNKEKHPEDENLQKVRGIYDMPPHDDK